MIQCSRYGRARGGMPPRRLLVPPPFRFTQITVLEHHSITREHRMMDKGIITFKQNSPLKFSRYFPKLLATNCCVTEIWRNIPSYYTPLKMCREREMQACRIVTGTSLVIMTQNNTWYIFFSKTSCLIFRAHSRFWGSNQGRNQGEGA